MSSAVKIAPAVEDVVSRPAEIRRGRARAFWESYGITLTVFALILAGYMLSFSVDENDSLDTVRWMQAGDIRAQGFFEFRHLIQRMLPFWLWRFLLPLHIHISAKHLLNLWDFATAAASVMLLYRVLHEITDSRPLAFGGSFAYATAHCIWIYVGSGRLYSTSLFLAFAGYFLALQMGRASTRKQQWVLAFAAATMTAFASMFWLVHIFNAIGVGLVIFLVPKQKSWLERTGYLALYGVTGIALALIVAASCLRYVEIPLTLSAVKSWAAATGTQPMQFDRLSLMKASYGQAHGILAMYELPYMINGLMLRDPALVHSASLPWQAGKFIFVWLLLSLVYLYPLAVFWKASRRLKAVILALYLPLAINMYFALGWLGSDVQRFMPTLLSQVGLGAIAARDLLGIFPKTRALSWVLVACLVFVAGDNFVESLLPSQRRYTVLGQEMKDIRPDLRGADLPINFGRDITVTYLTMTNLYAGAKPLNLTNDDTAWHYDRPGWKEGIAAAMSESFERGGRVFVMDRLALGFNPPVAEWSELQHPHPSLKEFSEFLRTHYCLTPAFTLEKSRYFQVSPRTAACPSRYLLRPGEGRR